MDVRGPGPGTRRMADGPPAGSWATMAREYMFRPRKSSRDTIAAMSPGRMSIASSAASCSTKAFGYVPRSSGSTNQAFRSAWERSAAATSSGSSLAG